MTTDDLTHAAAEYFAERYGQVLREIVLRPHGGGDDVTLSVPFTRPRPAAPVPAPPPEVPARKTSALRDAIFQAVFHAEKRLAGNALVAAVLAGNPEYSWDRGTIANEASRMASEGDRITNVTPDTGDEYGKGYGLAEWS